MTDKSIHIQNYRCFKDYKLVDLNRVNLLVGKNNCGKTSVLEAIHLLRSSDVVDTLAYIASKRGELSFFSKPPLSVNRPQTQTIPNINHFFYGHDIEIGSSFEINGFSWQGKIKITLKDSDEIIEKDSGFLTEVLDKSKYYIWTAEKNEKRASVKRCVFPNGGFNYDPRLMPGYRNLEGIDPKIHIIEIDSLNNQALRTLWDQAVIHSVEDEAVNALQVLMPQIQEITFLSEPQSSRQNGGVLVKLAEEAQRIPLGSLGEGMKRMLALALRLINAKGGVLLVDEIDTGLHYSVMQDMWRLVVAAALRFDFHVFATTHSLDCVNGLAELCTRHPDLGEHVSLQKIDPGLEASVALNGEGIALAGRQEIEVR